MNTPNQDCIKCLKSHPNNNNNFTTSDQVYASCMKRNSNNIINKNLVKTHESNRIRISHKLSTVGIKGTLAFIDSNILEVIPLKNKF